MKSEIIITSDKKTLTQVEVTEKLVKLISDGKVVSVRIIKTRRGQHRMMIELATEGDVEEVEQILLEK